MCALTAEKSKAPFEMKKKRNIKKKKKRKLLASFGVIWTISQLLGERQSPDRNKKREKKKSSGKIEVN